MSKPKIKHYSALGRITLCGKCPSKDIVYTNTIELVDCAKCLTRYKARQAILKSEK